MACHLFQSDLRQSEMSSRNCIVYPCKRRGGYRLPLDPELRLKWLEAIKWPIIPLEPKKAAVVCPTHFTKDDFIGDGNGGKKILKEQAIPSVFPWNSNLWSKEEMEGTALRSPSTSDEEEDEKSGAESNQSSDSEIEIFSSSSWSEEGSEDEAEDRIAAQGVADEIVTISSGDGNVSSGTTNDDPEKSTSAVACQDSVKESVPSNSTNASHPEKRRTLKKRRYDIVFTTSRSSSDSSDEEEPQKKAEPSPAIPSSKREDGEDSDESDCILLEKPIESIDLTIVDDVSSSGSRTPELSPSGILYDESDSSYEESLSDEVSTLQSLPPVLLDKVPWLPGDKVLATANNQINGHIEPISETDAEEENLMETASVDSDCLIIEDHPPIIDLNSDDEDALPVPTTASLALNGSKPTEIDQLPDASYVGISPYVDVPIGPVDPMTDISSTTVDPFAGVPETPVAPTHRSMPSPSGNLSPVASKDPNAPMIQRNSVISSISKTARSRNKIRQRVGDNKKSEKYISKKSQMPSDYEIVGIRPSSTSLKIVLSRKRVSKPEAHEKEVSVEPPTAYLHDSPSPQHTIQTSAVQIISTGKLQKTYYVSLTDLVVEETHLDKIILQRDHDGYEPHCEALSRKLVDIIRKSNVMAGRLSQETIMSVYSLLFLTEISYGTIYWGHCDGAQNVFELQKRFVGMMSKPKPQTFATSDTFRQIGILPLPSIYILHCLIHAHKNVDSIRKRMVKRTPNGISVFEAQGFEFYMALPPHMRRPHCDLPNFIQVVKKFLRQHVIFNDLEYFNVVSTFQSSEGCLENVYSTVHNE